MSEQKLIIVSNRLPVSVKKIDGKLEFSTSYGGLATGLDSIKEPANKIWVGWPGISSDELNSKDKKKITEELKKLGCVPVFLNDEQISKFYHGYSNETIWPLFHYFTGLAQYSQDYWNSFVEANKAFEKVVRKHVDRHTMIWVHDYQLIVLPGLIREHLPNTTIGFFLHIPFPSHEIIRTIPNRRAILRGMLGADLIGFHTYDYTRHFLSSVLRVLETQNSLGNFTIDSRLVRTDSFPISIDYKKYATSGKKKAVRKEQKNISEHYKGLEIILSFDRVDYTKGIIERLRAYEHFLQKYPQYHKKVVLVMIAAPSRIEVEAYQKLRQEIELIVGRINGEYSTVDWSPISYQFKTIDFDKLTALYSCSSVALVTPIRDGMNLIAKEYVAAKHDGNGVLILSERAGVASELPEALQINPNNFEKAADTIKKALEMPKKERRIRMKLMQRRIARHDIRLWANDFITQLQKTKEKQKELENHRLNEQNRSRIIRQFKSAKKPLLLLDYDGTLIDFADDPEPGSAKPSRKLKKLISKLAGREKNKLVIISGRPKGTLQSWFKNNTINLVAEHGGWIKDKAKWAKHKTIPGGWQEEVLEVMQSYVDRTPGSVIEEKDYTLVWHYRKVWHSLAYVRKTELINDLRELTANTEIGVYQGNRIVEVKPKSIHKGSVAKKIISSGKHDFVMCIGDDYTDEDMFEAVNNSDIKNTVTIKVGHDETMAQYHVISVDQVVALLEDLANLK